MKQINVKIDEKYHTILKTLGTLKGVGIEKYVTNLVIAAARNKEKEVNQLRAMLRDDTSD